MTQLLPLIIPGEILLEEFLIPLGISQNQLARDMDVPVSRISGIIKGERAITGDTALRLAAYFSTSADMWMTLQSEYELRKAQRLSGDLIKSRVRAMQVNPAAKVDFSARH
jgi:antitoxin HigA-1